jgi:hypothetical protein
MLEKLPICHGKFEYIVIGGCLLMVQGLSMKEDRIPDKVSNMKIKRKSPREKQR